MLYYAMDDNFSCYTDICLNFIKKLEEKNTEKLFQANLLLALLTMAMLCE